MSMFYGAIFLGFCSALGIFIVLLRCPRMWVLRILGYAWVLDIAASALMFAMHWGTAVGGFSAVIAGLFCSLGITLCKSCIGYMGKDNLNQPLYYKGWLGDCRPFDERDRIANRAPI